MSDAENLGNALFRLLLAALFLTLFSSLIGTARAAEPELPPPEQAFRLTMKAVSPDTLRAEWQIAPGFYLYRDKIHIKSQDPSVQLGAPVFPRPNEVKDDEFFGKMAIYRNFMSADIPITRRSGTGAVTFAVNAVHQGCADIGVCYPPLKQTLSVTLPAVTAGTSAPAPAPAADAKSNDKDFLPIEEAFVPNISLDKDRILVRWKIADGYFLYRDKFAFALKDSPGITLGAYTLPPGVRKNSPLFGNVEVYYKEAEITLPLQRTPDAAGSMQLEMHYQGCADAGFCYPPAIKTVALKQISPASFMPSAPSGGTLIADQDRYAASLAQGNRALTLLSFFGIGILLAFTPCIFPMIPILSSIIVGQGSSLSPRKGFLLSLTYVLAMAVTYTVAGVLAGLFGSNLQAAFQNPWILGGFSAVFVLLALSMFGFYDLQLPGSWQSKLTEVSNKQQGGTYIGTAIMGILSALIVGPCVAAPLAGALIYIGQSGDAVLGGMALFALSLGMGAPLLAIGASAGKWLPKAGGWMNAVKAVFGVLLLAVALWMLERILPGQVTMMLWAVLLIGSAVYMGAISHLEANATGWDKLWKGLGLVMLIYGALIMVGAAGGGNDVLQPLRGVSFAGGAGTGAAPSSEKLPFVRIKGIAGLEQALATAKAQNKAVMLDFYADWCISCKEMEKYTFSNPDVRAALSGMILLQSDVTANDEQDQALLKHFGLFGPPSMIFFGPDGRERRDHRLVGFLKPDKFRAHIESFKSSF